MHQNTRKLHLTAFLGIFTASSYGMRGSVGLLGCPAFVVLPGPSKKKKKAKTTW
jgi:hypothetical protein